MAQFVDTSLSNLPLRISDVQINLSKLWLSSIRISQVGHIVQRTTQRKNSTFESWSLAYVVKGSGSYKTNSTPPQIIEPGSVFFTWPDCIFNYGPHPGEVWEEYWIRFEGIRVEEWIHNQFLFQTVKKTGVHEAWIQKIETILLLIDSTIASNADRAAVILESLLLEIADISNHESNHKSQKIILLLDSLANSVYEPVNDYLFAEAHHISVATLRRLVKLHTGYPFNEYCHRLKISEAKKLLLNSNLLIKEIALRLCYAESYYFSRLFRKYSGISAQEYRERGI